MKSGGHIDQDWVSKLITRNRALKSSLTAIIQREAPDRSIDLETLIAAFYGATNTPGAISASRRVEVTRVHLTMKWVVSFLILRPFGPNRWRPPRRDGVCVASRR